MESDQGCGGKPIDLGRRRFLVALTTVVGGVGVAMASVPFFASMLPSARAEAAGGPVEVDLSSMQPGQQLTVEWRGKPVWIIKRTQEDLDRLNNIEDRLRDPHSDVEDQQPGYARNNHRSQKPQYLILVGICTHLGCSPVYKPYINEFSGDWPGGFFCPCHGSMFDMAGRVFKGVPAPINLEVPPYKFINDHTVMIGIDGGEKAA